MSARRTLATTRRVLTQLRRDPRTVALLLLVPVLLLVLLRYVFDDAPRTFDAIGGPLLALFPFITMFLVTSVAMLRERSSGTLERLLTTPLGKADLLLGYALAFGSVAVVQTVLASRRRARPARPRPRRARSRWSSCSPSLDALLGTALGLLLSAFARTEFQAVQFLPAFVLPQLLLCGLLAARDDMAPALQWLSAAMPLTYAVDGMQQLATSDWAGGDLGLDLVVVTGACLLSLVLGAATLSRRSA